MQNYTGKIKPIFGRYRKLHENNADFGNHDIVTSLFLFAFIFIKNWSTTDDQN